jgi:dolichol-phosphate mannosyltransferase
VSDVFSDLGRVLVVIPTYNEADNVEPIVKRTRTAVPEVDVLIADDNSPDGTGELADKLAAADDQVHVLHRPGKQGLGMAYRAGFAWAIEHGFDVICEMDADGSHQPEQLPDLLRALREADLVIGTRWIPGGRVENWSPLRKVWSRCSNFYARLILGIPLHDATGGFRAFRRTTLEGVALDDVESQGYCFQIDLAWRAIRAGYFVDEVPIVFRERERGASKMDLKVMFESFSRVTGWGLHHRFRQLRRLVSAGSR